jgi:hypothetical protein
MSCRQDRLFIFERVGVCGGGTLRLFETMESLFDWRESEEV